MDQICKTVILTLRLQQSWYSQTVVSYPEGILQVLSGSSQQGLPHVHQTGVNGLNDSQEGQTTGPAFPKVLHGHPVSITGHQIRLSFIISMGFILF